MRIATEIAYQTNGEITMTINKNNKKYHHVLKKYESESKAIKITKKLRIYYGM